MLFRSCHQSFPASGSFPISWLFTSGGKVLEFQLYHQSFQRTPRTESFTMDWLDLLAVQGTLKSLLQHTSKASILQRSDFFTVQLSHPYMTTGKTIALTAAAAAKSLQSCPTLCDPIDGNPLQYSCLENPSDGGASWAAFYGVAQGRTRLKRLSSSSQGYGFSSGHVWM